jgi:hypothetical protein
MLQVYVALVLSACFTCFMSMFSSSSLHDHEWMPYAHACAHECNANASLTPGLLQYEPLESRRAYIGVPAADRPFHLGWIGLYRGCSWVDTTVPYRVDTYRLSTGWQALKHDPPSHACGCTSIDHTMSGKDGLDALLNHILVLNMLLLPPCFFIHRSC